VIEPEKWMAETGAKAGTDRAVGVGKRTRRCDRQHQTSYCHQNAFTSHGYLLREVVEPGFAETKARNRARNCIRAGFRALPVTLTMGIGPLIRCLRCG
jgi:hypothetical protein